MALVERKERRARNRLAEKLLATALASAEFRDALAEASAEISHEIRDDDTEATVAGIFERVLYAELRTVGLAFHPRKETAVETERHVDKGRTDSRLGQLVIEYKRPARLRTGDDVAKACEQLENYLRSISSGEGAISVGLLTDGRRVMEIHAVEGRIDSRGPIVPLDGGVLRRIARHVHSLDLTALTADNLVRDLCEENGALIEAAKQLRAVLIAGETERTRALESEWRAMYRLGHRDVSQQRRIEERRGALAAVFGVDLRTPDEEYLCLFSLHTAYAIVLKLTAARVLSEVVFERQLTTWSDQLHTDARALRAFCHRLENGSLFRSLGLLNLLEGDFFSWYSDAEQWNDDVARAIETLIEVLARYEATTTLFAQEAAVDLFRRLYEAAVPQVVRASFGEFHTPTWLAEDLLDAGRFGPHDRLLDPCAGSGTVLVVAIDALREAHAELDGEALLNLLVKSVAGVDLNPLSVLTARVNYFIRVADLVPEVGANLVLPVFLGDASHVADHTRVDGVDCIAYSIATLRHPIEIVLPTTLVRDFPRFVRAMHDFEDRVRDDNAADAARGLVDELGEDEQRPEIVQRIDRLAARLSELHRAGWDGIWARVITNFLATAALPRFTLIAGNPPWVDWKNLPAGYRDEIKGLAIERHLFSGDGRTGGINLNICALIAHVATSNWLTDDGHLAFLMPRELAVQQSYQGWRRLEGRPHDTFLEFRDWTKAGHPFDPVKEDFMTYVIGPGGADEPVAAPTYTKPRGDRTKAQSWATRGVALGRLTRENRVAAQIIPGSTAFTFADSVDDLERFRLVAGECPYKGREGIEFYPQEIQLFRYSSPGPSPSLVWLKNIQVPRSRYRVAEQEVLVETAFLHPLVKGPHIERFKHAYDGLIVALPYDEVDPHRPLSRAELRERSPRLLAHYDTYADLIKAQTNFSDAIRGSDPGEFYGLARTGPYTFAPVYVAFRDNSKWRACVVSSEVMPWHDDRRVVFQNHAVSVCERPDGAFISESEAHYLCSILNAPVVEAFIDASSDNRSFKIRPPINVPVFDADDAQHLRLAELSRSAHASPDEIDALRTEIDDILLGLCARGS